LDEKTLAAPAVQELLVRGLHAPSKEVRLFVLKAVLRLASISDGLFQHLFRLVGDVEIDVGSRAVMCVVQFSSVSRLESAAVVEIVEALRQEDEVKQLRVMELLVNLVNVDELYAAVPIVSRMVNTLLEMCQNQDDVLMCMSGSRIFCVAFFLFFFFGLT
jgi:hypothetical protein